MLVCGRGSLSRASPYQARASAVRPSAIVIGSRPGGECPLPSWCNGAHLLLRLAQGKVVCKVRGSWLLPNSVLATDSGNRVAWAISAVASPSYLGRLLAV
eukprot:6005179-Amphidinium_carterae.2